MEGSSAGRIENSSTEGCSTSKSLTELIGSEKEESIRRREIKEEQGRELGHQGTRAPNSSAPNLICLNEED